VRYNNETARILSVTKHLNTHLFVLCDIDIAARISQNIIELTYYGMIIHDVFC